MPASIEYDKYQKLGAYHWDEYAANTVYAQHADRVRNWVRERPVLDAGCGDGLITHLLAKDGGVVLGIDSDAEGIRLAQERGVNAQIGDVYHPPSGPWAAVYLGDVLEHLDAPEKAIRALGKVTDTLYIATPPKGRELHDHRHTKEYTEEDLKALMRGMGWTWLAMSVMYARILGKFRK